MKSKRAIFMLALSILAGVAAVMLAARWMGQQSAGNSTRVVVAARDLQLGQAINATLLQEVAWPSATSPEGSFSEAAKLEGRVVRTAVFKGEPILAPKLAPEGAKSGLDSVIKDGRRAITVKVNEVVGVAGFLAPGSYVDLLVNIRDDRESAVSKIVLERIMVLAVAQEANRADETKPKVVNAVTLEVTPEEAEKIDLARNIGTLSLVLRNQVDVKEAPTDGMRRQDLFAKEVKAPAPVPVVAKAPAPPVRKVVMRSPARTAPPSQSEQANKVEVIRGVQKATSDF